MNGDDPRIAIEQGLLSAQLGLSACKEDPRTATLYLDDLWKLHRDLRALIAAVSGYATGGNAA